MNKVCYYCGKEITEKNEYKTHVLICSNEYNGRIHGIDLSEKFKELLLLPSHTRSDTTEYELIYSGRYARATDSGYVSYHYEVLPNKPELDALKAEINGDYRYDDWIYLCREYYQDISIIEQLKEAEKEINDMLLYCNVKRRSTYLFKQKYLELKATGSLIRYYQKGRVIFKIEFIQENWDTFTVNILGYYLAK